MSTMKEFALSNIGRLVLIGAVVLVAGGAITAVTNESSSNGFEQVVAEAIKQYSEAPYTIAALPSNETDPFVNARALPASWSSQTGCPAGSRATPNGGCWSLIIDANGVNITTPRWAQDQCLTITKALRPDVHRRIRFFGIAVDGEASLTNAVDLSTVNAELRKATVSTLGNTRCLNTTTNQISVIIQ